MTSSRSRFTRRRVLAGLAAVPAAPALAQHLPTNPDVVIIGAGAAGLSAARTMLAAGKTVIVVESAARVGGRAFAENGTFGVPYDHGCTWISAASENPFLQIARDEGFTLLNHASAGSVLFAGDRRASYTQVTQYDEAWAAITAAMNGAPGDVAASEVIPKSLPFGGTAKTWMGPMDYGVDLDQLSTGDWFRGTGGSGSYMVAEGLGSVVATLSRDVPVKLSTPATHVDWSGQGVRVTTPDGTITAKACLVTVSTGVLRAGGIRFTPELPDPAQDALDKLPMGLLVKVGLQFDGAQMGFRPNQWLAYDVDDAIGTPASFFVTWPHGYPYMMGFMGGRFGWEMSKAGEAAAVDFALGEVVKMVGSDAQKWFIKGHMTDWATSPNTLGAYAAARPGHAHVRDALARPAGDRVFFAGEALGGSHMQLVSGAYMSGARTAQDMLSAVL